MFSGKKAAYIHSDLRHWNENNGFFQIVEICPSMEDFGFDIKIIGNTIFFNKVRPSIAIYTNGKSRLWQGENSFTLPLYNTYPEVEVIVERAYRCLQVPDYHLGNNGGNSWDIYQGTKLVDCFIVYKSDKEKVAKEWFQEKIHEVEKALEGK